MLKFLWRPYDTSTNFSLWHHFSSDLWYFFHMCVQLYSCTTRTVLVGPLLLLNSIQSQRWCSASCISGLQWKSVQLLIEAKKMSYELTELIYLSMNVFCNNSADTLLHKVKTGKCPIIPHFQAITTRKSCKNEQFSFTEKIT